MKDLFYFSRGERNVLFVLLSLIVVAWIAIILTDQEKEEPSEATPVVSQAESPSAVVAVTLSRQPQLGKTEGRLCASASGGCQTELASPSPV